MFRNLIARKLQNNFNLKKKYNIQIKYSGGTQIKYYNFKQKYFKKKNNGCSVESIPQNVFKNNDIIYCDFDENYIKKNTYCNCVNLCEASLSELHLYNFN
jgi:hypothetical protein